MTAPQVVVSPPFKLSPQDWGKIGKGAILAVIGALAGFLTGEALPRMQENTNNELGVLIVAVLTAAVPILCNIALKFLGESRAIVKMLLIAVGLVLLASVPAVAADPFVVVSFSGAETAGAISINWSSLFQDPTIMSVIAICATLFASKVLKVDLTKVILPILQLLMNGLFKPPTPVSPTVPSMPNLPTVDPSTTLMQLLVEMLTKAEAKGDAQERAAIMTILGRISQR